MMVLAFIATPWGRFLLALVVVSAFTPFVPVPQNWGPEAPIVDVRVDTRVHWHPLSGEWSIDAPQASTKESHLVNLEAFFLNSLFLDGLSSPSRTLHITLEQEGAVLQEETDRTGRGGWFGSSSTSTVVFRLVPPGEYTIRARVMDGPTTIAETQLPLHLVEVP